MNNTIPQGLVFGIIQWTNSRGTLTNFFDEITNFIRNKLRSSIQRTRPRYRGRGGGREGWMRKTLKATSIIPLPSSLLSQHMPGLGKQVVQIGYRSAQPMSLYQVTRIQAIQHVLRTEVTEMDGISKYRMQSYTLHNQYEFLP